MGDSSRTKELAKNTMILTIGRICTQGISFLLLPLYTALLSQEEYGIVDLFNSYIALLIPIVNWQYDMGVFRFLLDERGKIDSQKRIFSSVFVANILQCAAYLILFFCIQSFINSPYKLFLAVDVVLNVFFNTFMQFVRGCGKSGIYSFASFLSAGLTVVLNVVLILGFRMGAMALFVSSVVSKVIALFYLFISQRLWKYISIKKFDFDLLKTINKYSLPLVPAQLSWWMLGTSDRTIISHFISVAANGIYSVSNKFSGLYITFYNIFNMAWTESVSMHINDEDRDSFFSDLFQKIFSLFSAVCIGIIAVMPFIYPLLINAEYASGYYQVPILMAAALCQAFCGMYNAIYLAVKKSKESAKTAFGAAIINIIVNLLFIRYIGIFAASVSTLVAYAVMAVYRYFDSQKYIKMRIKPRLLTSIIVVLLVDSALILVNNLLINLANLAIVILFAIYINKDMILALLKLLSNRRNNKV